MTVFHRRAAQSARPDTVACKASILGYMRDLSFRYITCAAVVVIVYWPSNPRHEMIYMLIYTTGHVQTGVARWSSWARRGFGQHVRLGS